MSTGKNPLNPAVGPDTPPVALSPDEVVQFLRTLRQQIPLPGSELAKVSRTRRIAHVDAKFIETAVATLGAYVGVQLVLGRSDQDVRREIDETSRWSAVADELRALLESVLGAIRCAASASDWPRCRPTRSASSLPATATTNASTRTCGRCAG